MKNLISQSGYIADLFITGDDGQFHRVTTGAGGGGGGVASSNRASGYLLDQSLLKTSDGILGKLTISGAPTENANLVLNAPTDYESKIVFEEQEVAKWTIGNDGDGSDGFRISAGSNLNTPYLTITSDGKAGLGTTEPMSDSTLSVSGATYSQSVYITGADGTWGQVLTGGGGTILSSGIAFRTALTSGVSSQVITFPEALSEAPEVSCTIVNSGVGGVIPFDISPPTNSQYTVNFTQAIPNDDYAINTLIGGGSFTNTGTAGAWETGTHGAENVIYYTGGNVGIGITEPDVPFHVQSAGAGYFIRFGMDGGATGQLYAYNSGVILASSSTTQKIAMGANGARQVECQNGSNGHTYISSFDSPSLRLLRQGVDGDSVGGAAQSIGFEVTTGGSGAGEAYSYENKALSALMAGALYSGSTGLDGYLYWSTRESGEISEKMRLTNRGNVGIGTKVPATDLHLKAKSGEADTIIGLSSADGTQNAAIAHMDEAGSERLSFRVGGFNESVAHMSILNNGNVGIGISDPSAPFHLQSPTAGYNMKFGIDGGATGQIYMGTNGTIYTNSDETKSVNMGVFGSRQVACESGSNGHTYISSFTGPSLRLLRQGVDGDSLAGAGQSIGFDIVTGGNGEGSAYGFENNVRAAVMGGSLYSGSVGLDGYAYWSTRDNGTVSEKMRLTNSGMLGVGTSTPSGKLSVSYASNTNPTALLSNLGGASTTLHIVENSLGNPATAPNHVGLFVGQEDGQRAVLMTKKSVVGIGTTGIASETSSTLTVSTNNGHALTLDNEGDRWTQMHFAHDGAGQAGQSTSAFVGWDNTNGQMTVSATGGEGTLDNFMVHSGGGIVLPRFTTTDMNNISSPTHGEMIYNITENAFYGYENGVWVNL